MGEYKIIGFDSWTGGAATFQRLPSAFKERGLDLVLIHIGSWGHDQGRPREEHIGDLSVRDISYYDGLAFKDILLHEKPAMVLFLSTQAFAHRAVIRYCRQLGIPTLHLYHGIVGVQATASKRLNPLNLRSQVTLALSRLAKNVFRLWPVYAKALLGTGASTGDWYWFGNDVWRQLSGQAYSGVAAPDASTTACCVYTDADKSHAMARYRVPRQFVYSVGNPDLEKFGLREKDMGTCLSSDRKATNQIVYIDTALIEAGAVFDDADDFVHHIKETSEALARQDFRLLVKLHYAHYQNGIVERLRKIGIEICPNEDFVGRLKTSVAAIVEPSSAALIPALLGLPLLLARFGKLAGQEYGAVLTSYPSAKELLSLDRVASLLDNIAASSSRDASRAWININAGPLPAENMPKRVADVCARLSRQCKTIIPAE